MSKAKFDSIIEALTGASDKDIVSMNEVLARLEKDYGKVTLPTISKYAKRTEQPMITDLSKILNPNGGIITGFYYYPQVLQVVRKYYKKVGRKPAVKK